MRFSDFKPRPRDPLRMVGPDGWELIQDKRLVEAGNGWKYVPSGFFYPAINGCIAVSVAYAYSFSFEGAFNMLAEKYPELVTKES